MAGFQLTKAFTDLHEGLGRHQETLTKNELVDFLRGFYFEELFYNIALAFVKVAVLLCYWRIFPTRYMKWTFSALVTIIGLWFTATTLVLILQCRPVRKAWDNQIEGTCYDRRAFFLGQGIPHIVTDAAILISPIYPIWKLNMKLYQKVALSGVFLMGGWWALPPSSCLCALLMLRTQCGCVQHCPSPCCVLSSKQGTGHHL